MLFNVVSLAVEAVSKLFLFVVMPTLGNAEYRRAFEPQQLYLPRLIGVLLQIAGLSYLMACFAALFAPTFADLILPAILLPPLIGESSFCLWLLVKGVNVAKWNERVGLGQGN